MVLVNESWLERSVYSLVNGDPSAGSPTETLLRLLLPLDNLTRSGRRRMCAAAKDAVSCTVVLHFLSPYPLAGATGGVYKGQGRNQHELMTRAY